MATLDELIEHLSEAPAARAWPMWWRLAVWVGICALYVGVLALCAGLRPDFAQEMRAPLYVAELGLLALIIASTGLSALVLSYPDMYQSPGLAWLPAVPLAGFAGLLVYNLVGVAPAPLPVHGMECLLCITLFSLLPATALFYYLRKQASTHVVATGAVALLAAFSVGCFALRLSEPVDSALHLVTWHYGPMIGSAIMGMAMGRVILKW